MEATPKHCSFCDLPAEYVLVEDGKLTDVYSCAEYFEPKTDTDDDGTQWVKIDD